MAQVFVVIAPVKGDKLVAGEDKLDADTMIPPADPGAIPADKRGLRRGGVTPEQRHANRDRADEPPYIDQCGNPKTAQISALFDG